MSEATCSTPRPAAQQAAAAAWRRWQMAALGDAEAPAAAAAQDVGSARRERDQAREDAVAQGRAEGFAAGHAQGYADGVAAGRAQVQEQAARLAALADSLTGALQRADVAIAQDVVALAIDVARQVIDRTYAGEPAWLLPLVCDLLRQEPALQGAPRLLLHPQDAELVSTALGPQLQAAGWLVRADPGVGRGGCIVQADNGAHDATLPTRWERVCRAVQGLAEQAQ